MDDLNLYAYVDPQGQQHELAPKSEGFMAERITLKDEGAYYVFAEKKPGFYTMYEEDGRIHHKMGTMEGCSNVVLSLYYEEYAKALVTVGQPNNDAMTKPVGHALEIVPLQNPMSLKQGDLLQVQVLFNGQPARFCEVLATYQGFSSEDDFAFATIANGKGIHDPAAAPWPLAGQGEEEDRSRGGIAGQMPGTQLFRHADLRRTLKKGSTQTV